MSELVRTEGGMVHRYNCEFALNGVPWVWADDKSKAELSGLREYGLRFCSVCQPLKEESDDA